MGQELREDVNGLRGIAEQLNATTAEAAAVVQAVDQFLGEELCVGVTAASRPFESQRALGDDNRELVVTTHLAFGRVQGKDRIYVLKATLEKNEWKENFTKIVAEDRTAWADCSREVKLQSFAMLPELLGNLAARVDDVAAQTSRTIDTVRELIEVMKLPRQRSEPTLPAAAAPVSIPATATTESEQEQERVEEAAPEPVPLQELTISAAPGLYRRPRARL
jgi:hypothetical protein